MICLIDKRNILQLQEITTLAIATIMVALQFMLFCTLFGDAATRLIELGFQFAWGFFYSPGTIHTSSKGIRQPQERKLSLEVLL